MKWIKYSEQRPNDRQSVLVFDGKQIYMTYFDYGNIAFYLDCMCHCSKKVCNCRPEIEDITHWAELPEPPKDNE